MKHYGDAEVGKKSRSEGEGLAGRGSFFRVNLPLTMVGLACWCWSLPYYQWLYLTGVMVYEA